MVDPKTDEDLIRGIVQAADMDPIPVSKGQDYQLIEKMPSSDVVSSGGTEDTEITPPSGKVYRIIDFYADIPAVGSATSGEHNLNIYAASIWMGIWLSSNYDNKLGFQQATMYADKESRPTDGNKAWKIITSYFSTPGNPLTFHYINDTDADQTDAREYKVLVQEIPLAE